MKMTIEKAISIINWGRPPKQEYKKMNKAYDMAISALEKQIPKKIKIWNGQAECPCCKKFFGNMSDIQNLIAWDMPHCKWCGQKLLWEDKEE